MKLLKQIFAMLFAIGAYFSPLALDAMKPPHQIGNPNARLKMAAQAKLGKNQIPPIKAPKKIGKPEARESKKFSNRQWVGKKKVILPVGQGERIVIEEEKLETPNAEQAKPNAGLPASEKENAQAPEATRANAGLPTSQAASGPEQAPKPQAASTTAQAAPAPAQAPEQPAAASAPAQAAEPQAAPAPAAPEATSPNSANAGQPASQAASGPEQAPESAAAPTTTQAESQPAVSGEKPEIESQIYRNALELAKRIPEKDLMDSFERFANKDIDEIIDNSKKQSPNSDELKSVLTYTIALLLVKKPADLSDDLFNNAKEKIFTVLTKSLDLIKNNQIKNDLSNALNNIKNKKQN